MSATTCDRRALSVARALHERESPQATILFGSRARGDYDEYRSDIDIMVIQPALPDYAYQKFVVRWASAKAQAAYGRPVPVDVTWFAQDDFQKHNRYVNHVTTRALLDGVVMSNNPEDYRSRYEDAAAAEPEYSWEDYETRLLDAEEFLTTFQDLADLNRGDRQLGRAACSTLEHAMKAVIAAHGASYPSTHELGILLGTVRRLDPELRDFSFSIRPEIYSDYVGRLGYDADRRHPALTEHDDYRARTVADAERLIARAREARQTYDG